VFRLTDSRVHGELRDADAELCDRPGDDDDGDDDEGVEEGGCRGSPSSCHTHPCLNS